MYTARMKGAAFSISILVLLASTILFSVVNAAESALPQQRDREVACTVVRTQLCAASQPNACSITPVDCGFVQQNPFAGSSEAGKHATFFLVAFAGLLGITLYLVMYGRYDSTVQYRPIAPPTPFSFSEIPQPLLANGLSSFRF